MTLKQVTDLVFAAPHVESGFVKQTEDLTKVNLRRDGDAWHTTLKRRTIYTVFVLTDETSGYSEQESMAEAVKEAFEKAKLTPPELG